MHPVSKPRASFPLISRQTLRNNGSQFRRLARCDTCYNEQGFALHKGAFRNVLCLRYGWLPSGLRAKCVTNGHSFTVDHAMNCSSDGSLLYVIMISPSC